MTPMSARYPLSSVLARFDEGILLRNSELDMSFQRHFRPFVTTRTFHKDFQVGVGAAGGEGIAVRF